MISIDLTEEQIAERYKLFCAASDLQSQQPEPLKEALYQLNKLIQNDLIELSRSNPPSDITRILASLNEELHRFGLFCEFPHLATKSVVGFGGGFSAGKSSLINRLIDRKYLAVQVDPTTSMPAYVLHDKEEKIQAINLHDNLIELTSTQLSSLTHEEKYLYGSQIGSLLQAAYISLPDFPWHNLAFLDTPGYSKPDDDGCNEKTDADRAELQLKSANYIIWAVSLEHGTIPEADIQFLAKLNDIPKCIVITHADKRLPDDVVAIEALIRHTLQERGISFTTIIPFSRKKKSEFSLQPLLTQFDEWNKKPRAVQFAQNFKRLFIDYRTHFNKRRSEEAKRLNILNKVVALIDDENTSKEAEILRRHAQGELTKIESSSKDLSELEEAFFTLLKKIGDEVNIELPEPHDLDLLDLRPINLSTLLENYCKEYQINNVTYDYFADLPPITTDKNKLQSLLRWKKQSAIEWSDDFTVCPEQKKALLRQVEKIKYVWEINAIPDPNILCKLLRKKQYNENITHLIDQL